MGRSGVLDIRAKNTSPELEAVQRLEEVAQFLDVEKWIVQRLQHPEREVQLNLQIINDQNEARIFRACRVRHSSVQGPGMGPVYFSRAMSAADLHAYAMELSWQCALWKLPFCGSAGAISADLDELSERETRLLTSSYIRALQEVIGSDRDVITPERNCFPQLMAWAASALGKADHETLATITGKPVTMGGVDGKAIAARFLRMLVGVVLKDAGKSLSGARVALLGFDSHGRQVARELERAGANIVAVADNSGAVYERSGLNAALLLEHVERERMIFGYPDATAITNHEMVSRSYDTVILCGPQEFPQPTSAGFVFEAGGNALRNSSGRNQVVPALLADFGLTFAYFCEWRKKCGGGLAELGASRGLPAHVKNTWREVQEYAKKHELDLSKAALAVAVSRMAEALRMR